MTFLINVVFACVTGIVCGLFCWMAVIANPNIAPLFWMIAVINGVASAVNAVVAVIIARSESRWPL